MVRFLAVTILSLFAISNGFNIQPRIFNGDLSNPDDFPFYVVVESWGDIFCGGTILSDRWILTAAHCSKEPLSEICFGVNSTGECRAKIPVPESKQHVHPLYQRETHIHDIALFELSTPITFNEFIQPAKLSTACDIPQLGGQDVTAIGMGGTAYDQDIPRSEVRLRQADFVTKSADYCATETIKVHNNDYPQSDILRADQLYGMTCIEPSYARNQSTFLGDSGGPVILKDSGAYTALMSFRILSKTSPTGTSLHVFTYVPYYYEWIERRTGLQMPKCNGPQADAFA